MLKVMCIVKFKRMSFKVSGDRSRDAIKGFFLNDYFEKFTSQELSGFMINRKF